MVFVGGTYKEMVAKLTYLNCCQPFSCLINAVPQQLETINYVGFEPRGNYKTEEISYLLLKWNPKNKMFDALF